MKIPISLKHVIFTMTIMMIGLLPNLMDAQRALDMQNLQKNCSGRCGFLMGNCPSGCLCFGGFCRKPPSLFDPGEIRDLISVSYNTDIDILFALAEVNEVTMNVYDVNGKLIKSLEEVQTTPEGHQFEWDKTDASGISVSSGLYILQLEAGPGYSGTQKRFVIN